MTLLPIPESEKFAVSFEDEWARFHPTCSPVGWMMRNGGERHWLRFHSLPESKRYAETDEERAAVLGRANAIATEVFGEGQPVWLVQTCWDTPEGMVELMPDPFAACRDFELKPSTSFVEDPTDDEPIIWRAHAALKAWKSGAFNALLQSIAADQAAPTLWMSASSGAVFAPYDGGIDLFLPSASEVSRLKHAHPDWLSGHTQGL